MRKGGGKSKGSKFERDVCKALSRWVTDGSREDVFWRSAMSGGRATQARKSGKVVRQAGDICTVSAEGHAFTDLWYVECKFYKDISFASWLLNNTGPIKGWWSRAKREARIQGKEPMLIVKQNGQRVVIVITRSYMRLNAYAYSPPVLHSITRDCDVQSFAAMVSCSRWADVCPH